MEKPWKVIAAFVGVFIAGSIFGGLLALRLSHRDVSPRSLLEPVKAPPTQMAAGPAAPNLPTITAATPPTTGTPSGSSTSPRPTTASTSTTATPQMQLPPGMAVQAPQLMRRYVDRLSLTAEQKDRINPLILRAAADLRRQQQTNFRETGVIFQHLQEDIGKELTPVQRVRLEEMAEKQRQIIEQHEKKQQELLKQQQEKARSAQGTKPPARDGGKTKSPTSKPVDDGN